MIDLSVLVPSIAARRATFAPRIQEQLFGQVEVLPDPSRVEVLVLTDNQTLGLGHKRNLMVSMAQGRYVVFVDDDDRVTDDYIAALLEATASDCDAIVFQCSVSLNGKPPKICYHSKDHKSDHNTATAYYRFPSHICAVKRELSLLVPYESSNFGEDTAFSRALLPHLTTEHRIDRVLYHYDYNTLTTATRGKTPPQVSTRKAWAAARGRTVTRGR